MRQAQPIGWDKRCWAIGLMTGSGSGLLYFLCRCRSLWALVNIQITSPIAAWHIAAINLNLFVGHCCLIICFVIVPIALNLIAERYSFWWGLLPITLILLAGEAANIDQKQVTTPTP